MSHQQLPTATVLQKYDSRSKDGLSLNVGDVVYVLSTDDEYWWHVRNEEGRSGLCPAGRLQLDKSSESRRRVTAVFDYEAAADDELSLRAGDVIDVVARSKSGWWKGRIGTREGLFPANRTNADAKHPGDAKPADAKPADSKPVDSKNVDAKPVDAKPADAKHVDSKPVDSKPVEAKDPPKVLRKSEEAPPKTLEMVKEPPKTDGNSVPDKKVKRLSSPVESSGTDSPVLSSSSSGLSPRRALQSMFSKLKKGSNANLSPSASPKPREMEIAHPFEQPKPQAAEPDHFELLDAEPLKKPNVPREVDTASASQKRRVHILVELIETEEHYIKDMEMIVELFLVPMRAIKIISKAEADSVFLNIPHLIPINHNLLEKLREQTKLAPEEQCVGSLFIAFANESINEYTQYASQSQLSGKTLLALSKTNPQWAKFLEETYPNPKMRDLKLDTYLIKPVQRVCRYPLILQELLRVTDAKSPDHAQLQVAIDKMGLVIAQINEHRREAENLHHVVEIENSLRSLPSDLKLVAPGRTFVMEAMMELATKKGKKKSAVIVWMFSDCLVYAKQSMRSNVFKGVVFFNMALIQDLADSADLEHAFELIEVDKKQTTTLCCASEVIKQNWLRAISESVEKSLQDGIKAHKRELSLLGSSGQGVTFADTSSGQGVTFADTPTVHLLTSGSGSGSGSLQQDGSKPRIATTQQQNQQTQTQQQQQQTVVPPPIPPKPKISLSRASDSVVVGQGSVRIKGKQRTQRVLQLRDDMMNASSGVERAPNQQGPHSVEGFVFRGHTALDWVRARFECQREQALQLMSGLLKSGVIAPVFETPAEEFLDGYTAFYVFQD